VNKDWVFECVKCGYEFELHENEEMIYPKCGGDVFQLKMEEPS